MDAWEATSETTNDNLENVTNVRLHEIALHETWTLSLETGMSMTTIDNLETGRTGNNLSRGIRTNLPRQAPQQPNLP
jgi:hypothetical protein